jgi:hypothetical protein
MQLPPAALHALLDPTLARQVCMHMLVRTAEGVWPANDGRRVSVESPRLS